MRTKVQLMHFRGADHKSRASSSNLQVQTKPSPSLKKDLGFEINMTLKQACPSEYQGAQDAFKDSMIHWILQFTLLIAFRCVLHRCESQEIRCWKLYLFSLIEHHVHKTTNVVYKNKVKAFTRAKTFHFQMEALHLLSTHYSVLNAQTTRFNQI